MRGTANSGSVPGAVIRRGALEDRTKRRVDLCRKREVPRRAWPEQAFDNWLLLTH